MNRTFCSNRKARHEYFLMEGYEAGIALKGTEVKSVRAGRASLKESYGRVKNGEVYLYNLHISPYNDGNVNNHDPLRPRKLLLHKREIRKLIGKTKEESLTLIPTRLYQSGKWIKVDLHLAKGKKQYDKREARAKLDAQREIQRAMKDHNQRGR
ncbi:MAG: SsrA-binding protein SmpB [Deltaproteobacteria bacterium]|nr:SsrA-binding protein SmpB [Deltaproteobacteria bacterium]